MIKTLFTLLLVLKCTISYSDTIKTDVLVIGGGASGVAAAIQSARSNVKTMLIEQGPWLGGSMTAGGMCILEANHHLAAGIYREFKGRIINFYKNRTGYDTTYSAPLVFEPFTGAVVLKKITDTVKNLTVRLKTSFITVKKDGTGWQISITVNGKTDIIKAKVLIDATELGDAAAKAGAFFNSGFESHEDTGETLAPGNATNQIQDISWIAVLQDHGKAVNPTLGKPEGYEANFYQCLTRARISAMLANCKLPNDKYMINWSECANQYSVTSDDLLPENRANTFKQARLRTLGLIYYIQTVLGYTNLGLTNEFPTTDHLPMIPFIRENRRAAGLARMVLEDIYTPNGRTSKLFRTSIGVGDALPGQHYSIPGAPRINYPPFPAYAIPLGIMVVKGFENFFITEKGLSVTHLVNGSITDPSVQMSLGQGAGAAAAYCAFFNKTTKELDVRKIQEEILNYKGSIMPFADIPGSDPSYRAVQQISATGLLQGYNKITGNKMEVLFKPDTAVYTSEVMTILNELYSRSFLWFNKTAPDKYFTIGNLLSYISEMTLTDAATLQKMIQASWTTKYKLSGTFDPKRPVTRHEFAVLANSYLNPFARKINIYGKLIN